MSHYPQPRRRSSGGGCCFACSCGGVLVVTLLIGLCGAIFIFFYTQAPEPPQPNFTPEAAAASRFESKVSTSAVQSDGQFSVSVTEAEVSSWINLNSEVVQDAEIPLQNIQARFRNNETSVYAEVDTGLGNVGVEFGLILSINPDGHVDVQVSTVNFGGVGVPNSFKQDISEEVQRGIDEQLRSINGSYRVTFISATDGVLNIRGRIG